MGLLILDTKNFRAAKSKPTQPLPRNATGITMISNRKIQSRRSNFLKNQNPFLSILFKASSQTSQ